MANSMTAFARSISEGDWGSAQWEVRSVNHRYLDIIFKLPEALRPLEMDLRAKASNLLKRGKVDVFLRLQLGAAFVPSITLNDAVVNQLLKACHQITDKLGQNLTLNPLDILRWPDAIKPTEIDYQPLKPVILDSFQQVLQQLVAVRQREGLALTHFITTHISALQNIVEKIQQQAPKALHNYRQQLLTELQQLAIECDNNRLEQELVMVATRLDITEEIERLSTHLQEVQRALLNEDVVGRHLDFLMQELNREVNTIGSKCNDANITRLTVEAKVLIDKMREQIQNIE